MFERLAGIGFLLWDTLLADLNGINIIFIIITRMICSL
jgi:hypothetical protein